MKTIFKINVRVSQLGLFLLISCQEKPKGKKEQLSSEPENTPPTADIKAPKEINSLGIKEADITISLIILNRRVRQYYSKIEMDIPDRMIKTFVPNPLSLILIYRYT